MEITNSTNNGKYLLIGNKLRIVGRGTERMPQSIKSYRRASLHRSAHPQRDQDQAENLAMAWIDYEKAYHIVPQSWIINCLKMYKISDAVINVIEKTMKICRVELTAGGRNLAEAKIQRRVFQGDDLSS